MPVTKRPQTKADKAARRAISATTKAAPGAPRNAKKEEAARVFAVAVARSLHDDKCTDVIALDVRGRSQVADFIVVATGASERQMRSSSHRIADLGDESDFRLFRSNKDAPAQSWFVLDFVDVVAHVFETSARAYYDLEMMWGDAPRVAWQRPTPPPHAPKPAAQPAAKPRRAPVKKKAAAAKTRAKTTRKRKP